MTRPGTRTISNCHLEEAGRSWDAVRVPRSVGLTALGILGGRSGAVLEDPHEVVLYWFIAPGTIGWQVPNTRILAKDAHLVIPPARRTQGPGPHWRICPGDDGWVTDRAALCAAIEDALGPDLASSPTE